MLLLLADENVDGAIIRGLGRRYPELDLVRVQDVGLRGADDPAILAFAADSNRIVVTRDGRTMPDHAHDRVRSGQRMPGVVVISDAIAIGVAIEDLAALATCSEPADLDHQVIRLPL